MKVFISYSFDDKDEYLVSLLVSELRKSDFSIASKASVPHLGDVQDFIQTSDFFIGIITKGGKENKSTIIEWRHAAKHKKPKLLIVESGVRLSNVSVNTDIIYFNKKNPEEAIRKLKLFHDKPLALINKSISKTDSNANVKSLSKEDIDKSFKEGVATGLAIAGVAVLLIGLIGLIASGSSRSSK